MTYEYECYICYGKFNGCDAYIFHMCKYGSEYERFRCVFENCMITFKNPYTFKRHLLVHQRKRKLNNLNSIFFLVNPFT